MVSGAEARQAGLLSRAQTVWVEDGGLGASSCYRRGLQQLQIAARAGADTVEVTVAARSGLRDVLVGLARYRVPTALRM